MNETGLSAGTLLRAARTMTAGVFGRTAATGGARLKLGLPFALLCAGGLGAAAMAAVGSDSSADPDRARIEGIVREYILAHPEILPEAMERLQARKAAVTIQEHRADLETPYAGAWEGAKDADVTLVEFYDYACGYCRKARPDIERLLADDPKLKLVYRQLPILGEDSVMAARVGLYAAEQGRYPAFHRAIFAGGDVGKGGIVAAAVKAGLDKAKVETVLAARTSSPEFEKNVRLARAIEATGTPTFVVGDEMLAGAVGYEVLKEAVAKARSLARNRVASGG